MVQDDEILTATAAQNRVKAWLSLCKDEQRAQAISHIDKHLVCADSSRPGNCIVIFNHVPKTGGETLEKVFAANERVNETLHINRPVLVKNPAVITKLGRVPGVIMGHHPLNSPLYGFVDRPLLHLTMIRDPVARVWSWLRYVKARTDHKMHAEVRDTELADLLQRPDISELHNAMTKRLCGCLQEQSNLSDEALVDLAFSNLTERFSLFGLTEHFDRSLLMFASALGWSHPYYKPLNVTPNQATRDDPSQLLATIEANNRLDCELYARARELFLSRSKNYTGSALRRYRIRNKLWALLAMD